jgi:hypothetical protein
VAVNYNKLNLTKKVNFKTIGYISPVIVSLKEQIENRYKKHVLIENLKHVIHFLEDEAFIHLLHYSDNLSPAL